MKKRQIEIKTQKITNLVSMAIGLMFHKPKILTFVFSKERVVRLHTFFVFYPILILSLDKNQKIISKKIMLPFSHYSTKGRYIVEVPLCLIKGKLNLNDFKFGTKIGFK